MAMKYLFAFPMMSFFAIVSANAQTPLPNAHAHNDYEHERPLLDALDHGFGSIEVDVWLEDGVLLVGHDREDLTPERTLEGLYLEPLSARVEANDGRVVYSDGPEVILLVDIKNHPADAYRALVESLKPYEDMLTTFTNDSVTERAVRVIVSGGRPLRLMLEQEHHLAAYDGRIPDLDKDYSPQFMPLVSASFQTAFPGATVPLDEKTKSEIRVLTDAAHAKGRKFRFWATPEDEVLWNDLLGCGVDLINTDELARLQSFLDQR